MIEPDPENKSAPTPDIETQELSLDQLQQVSGGIIGSSTIDGATGRVDRKPTVAGWDLIKGREGA